MPSQFPIEEYLKARAIQDQVQPNPLVNAATAFTTGMGQGMVKRQEANVKQEEEKQKLYNALVESHSKGNIIVKKSNPQEQANPMDSANYLKAKVNGVQFDGDAIEIPKPQDYDGLQFNKDDKGNITPIINPLTQKPMSSKDKINDPVGKEIMRGQKEDQYQNRQIAEMVKYIDPSNSVRSAMGVSKLGQVRAERIAALEKSMPAGNLDKRHITEMAIGLNSILAGNNVSAIEQVKELIPKSLIGNIKGTMEWVTNKPQGLEQQAFVKRLGDTIRREAQTMENQVKQMVMQRISAYPSVETSSPKEWENALKSFGISPKEYRDMRENGFNFPDVVPEDPYAKFNTGTNTVSTLSPEKEARYQELLKKQQGGK